MIIEIEQYTAKLNALRAQLKEVGEGLHMEDMEKELLELKEEMNDTRNMRIRYHLVSRIKKACSWAEQLMTLCHQLGDDRTALESDAYYYFMKGNEAMETSEWVGIGTSLGGRRRRRWRCSSVRRRSSSR